MSRIIPKFKPFFFALVGFFAAVGILSLSHVGPASAQSPGVNLAALVAKVNSLQGKLTADEQTLASQGNTIATLQSLSNGQASEITDLNSQADYQASQITALKTLTAPLSLSNDPNAGGTNTLLTIKGVNVQIVDGSGYTDDGTQDETSNTKLSGLGNLILGYNAADPYHTQARNGSHNLILGDRNNYSSFGGLVTGADNSITGPYASVSGGAYNTASGYYASVSGGVENTASGSAAAVGGGYANTAGGGNDQYNVDDTSISGGLNLTQTRQDGWAAGTDGSTNYSGDFSSP